MVRFLLHIIFFNLTYANMSKWPAGAGILSWNINGATESLASDHFQRIHGSHLALHNAVQRMNSISPTLGVAWDEKLASPTAMGMLHSSDTLSRY